MSNVCRCYQDTLWTALGKNTNGIQVFLKIFVSYSHGWQVPTMHGPIHARINGTHLRGRFELGLRYCNIAFKLFFSTFVPSLS
jgi:hypothetical protein